MRVRVRRLPLDGQGRRGRAGVVPSPVTRAPLQVEHVPSPKTPYETATETRTGPVAYAPPSLARPVAAAIGVADTVRRVTVAVPEVAAAREAVPRSPVKLVRGVVPTATVVRGRVAPPRRAETDARVPKTPGPVPEKPFLAPRWLVGLVTADDAETGEAVA